MAIVVTSSTDKPENTAPAKEGAVASKEATQSAPEPKAQEQNKATESDTAATEEVEGEKTEGSETETDETEEGQDGKDKPGKKKGGFQRRIDKLSAKMRTTEEERDYWRTQALQKKEAGDAKSAVVDEPKVLEGKSKPKPDDFETYAEYTDALTDWKIDQRESVKSAEAEKSKLKDEQAKLLTTHQERVKSFAAKTEDYQEVMESVDDVPVSSAFQELIFSSEHGPEIMYELAKNRAECERITKLSPLACARELGKLEAKLAGRSSETKTKETNTITKAPKPIDPVGKNSKSVVNKSLDDPNISQSEYEAIRREQRKQRAASW